MWVPLTKTHIDWDLGLLGFDEMVSLCLCPRLASNSRASCPSLFGAEILWGTSRLKSFQPIQSSECKKGFLCWLLCF